MYNKIIRTLWVLFVFSLIFLGYAFHDYYFVVPINMPGFVINGTGGRTERSILLSADVHADKKREQTIKPIIGQQPVTIIPKPQVSEVINFYNTSEEVTIRMFLDETLEITFAPVVSGNGKDCGYWTNKACVIVCENYTHAIIHSGWGNGEAEPLRSFIEGSVPRKDLATIYKNIENLVGDEVDIIQAKKGFDGKIVFSVRIEPQYVQDYILTDYCGRLEKMASYYPQLSDWVNPDKPFLLIETCMWNHPSEPDYPWLTKATGAILLVGIQ